jgi:two-component system NtrC family response regulator
MTIRAQAAPGGYTFGDGTHPGTARNPGRRASRNGAGAGGWQETRSMTNGLGRDETGRRIRLLIVDDEVEFLDSIGARLEMRDFDVTTATDGEAALDAARNHRFDVALLDLKMPGLDGREVLELLKREHRFLEVIILTGHGSIDSAVECTKLGAFDYLSKPFNLEMLLQKVQIAYETRLQKKFAHDEARLERIARIASRESPLGILRELRKMDDDEQ